jgi:hypothetical protein
MKDMGNETMSVNMDSRDSLSLVIRERILEERAQFEEFRKRLESMPRAAPQVKDATPWTAFPP